MASLIKQLAEEMEAKDRRIAQLEAELKALKPRCLYEGYANARDYLEAVMELPKYREIEDTFCRDKKAYNAMVAIRRPAKPGQHPFYFMELKTPIPPRADGRKIATASLERVYGCPIRTWFKQNETPYLRNCPLYEGDCFLEELRAKHTDEELEDLFYSFQGWEKKTWTEAHAEPTPLEVAEAKLADAEERAERAERRLAAAEKKLADVTSHPEIRGQSAMQMVIGITLIVRACPDAGFQEIHDMWAAHADADKAQQERKGAANSGGAALASYLGDWVAGGMEADKSLCACLEPCCPTFDKIYVRGRGFVDRVLYAEEQREAEAEEEDEEWDCSCATPEMCRRDCEESEIARELFRSTGVPATNAQIAAVKRERHAGEDDEAPCRCYKQHCAECNPEGLVDERS